MPASMTGPGTNWVSMIASTGTTSSAIPSPTDACSAEPTAMTRLASTISGGDGIRTWFSLGVAATR